MVRDNEVPGLFSVRLRRVRISIATRPAAMPIMIPAIPIIIGANWKLRLLAGCRVMVVLLVEVAVIVDVIRSVIVYPTVPRWAIRKPSAFFALEGLTSTISHIPGLGTAASKAYEVAMSWLVMASAVVPQVPPFNQASYFPCCTMKKLIGLSEVKFPYTYSPVVVVKFTAQSSQGRFVPVVEGTVNAPL